MHLHLLYAITASVTVLAVSLLLGGTGDDGRTWLTLSGIVTSREGQPIPGTHVSAGSSSGEGEYETTTDENGWFSVQLPKGNISVYFGPPRSAGLASKQINLGHHESSFSHDVRLERGFLVFGKVILPDGNPPGRDLWISLVPINYDLDPNEILLTSVRADGSLREKVVPPGVYWMDFPDDLPDYFLDLSTEDAVDLVVDLGEPSVDLEALARAAEENGEISITGTITDAGGVPIEGVIVTVVVDDHDYWSRTDSVGFYHVEPPATDVVISASPPLESGFVSTDQKTGYRDMSFVVDFVLERGSLISGRVILPDGSPPGRDLWIGLVPINYALDPNENLWITVSAEGRLHEKIIPPGVYWMDFPDDLPDYFLDLSTGNATGLVVELGEPFNDLEALACAAEESGKISITGTITDAGGVPIEGVIVTVVVDDHDYWSRTDPVGFYHVEPPATDVVISASPPLESGFVSTDQKIGYRDMSFVVDFVLERGFLISGRVILPDGNPPGRDLWIGLVPINYALDPNENLWITVSAEGRLHEKIIPPGVYWMDFPDDLPDYFLDLSTGNATGLVVELGEPFDDLEALVCAAEESGKISITGTVKDCQGIPVPGAGVGGCSVDCTYQFETRTDSMGFYHAELPAGNVEIGVLPPKDSRLVRDHMSLGWCETSLIHDSRLEAGFLLSGRVVPLEGWSGREFPPIDCQAMSFVERINYWTGANRETGSFSIVLPPGIYSIGHNQSLSEQGALSSIWHGTPVDLTKGDVGNVEVILGLPARETSIPEAPPDATRISVSPPDDLGFVEVVGDSGSVIPLGHVAMFNLQTFHYVHAASKSDGSFAATIFAPSGSPIAIKHGGHSERWIHWPIGFEQEWLQPYPATIIHVPLSRANEGIPFSVSGSIWDPTEKERPNGGHWHVGASWTLAGSMMPSDTAEAGPAGAQDSHQTSSTRGSLEMLSFDPGEEFRIEARLTVCSPQIGPDIEPRSLRAWGGVHLLLQFDEQGRSLPASSQFMSTLLTPTGFPILEMSTPSIPYVYDQFYVTEWRYAGTGAVEANLELTVRIPDDIRDGVYRPMVGLDFSGVPLSQDWLAGAVDSLFGTKTALLPPLRVGRVNPPRLYWLLQANDPRQGTRGAAAREDADWFGFASQIVTQGAQYCVQLADLRTGEPTTYRLEPFLPALSYTGRSEPLAPVIPLALPGGDLSVRVEAPDGATMESGTAPLVQSRYEGLVTEAGSDLNPSTTQMQSVYSLSTNDERYRVTFNEYGHHVITMTGHVEDIWGNVYEGGGTYDLWVAEPLDIDLGVLPGTPFEAGDAFCPSMQLHPQVPAEVEVTIAYYPDSDRERKLETTFSGTANEYGYFAADPPPFIFEEPGEFRVDVTAKYWDVTGRLHMGSMVWGAVVETPGTPLVAHGRRGTDANHTIPGSSWFDLCGDVGPRPGETGHLFNPYLNGDILWGKTYAGKSFEPLIITSSFQDTSGAIEAVVRERADRLGLHFPPSIEQRFAASEIPLFTCTHTGLPAQVMPEDIEQYGYAYLSSQRPGVRVRELVADDGYANHYWNLNTLYGGQLGVGLLGDAFNDFKFQYVGIVYRDVDSGLNQYAIQGSLWVFEAPDSPRCARVMPPFAGEGNGGWTTDGGPILILGDEPIHMFILPTGVGPGAVLEVGDTFTFAGHIAPTLDSQVQVVVTSPSGKTHEIDGRANKIGFFYDPATDFDVDEPGVWTVDVCVWHDGYCSGGRTTPPYPSGGILGSEAGRYVFYVVLAGEVRLDISTPAPGFLSFTNEVSPILITGTVPASVTDAVVDYTITMPGYTLDHGQVLVEDGVYRITFDPASLHEEFPNLDLVGRDDWGPGLSDTFSIGLLMKGEEGTGAVYRANVVTIQGEQVFVSNELDK